MEEKKSLYKEVISDTNIYNAIYCLESYIFEEGLLDKDDLEKYVCLRDKFDFVNIEQVITKCKGILEHLLKKDNDELFCCEVFFKLKKFDKENNKIVYRPLHTASLEDQICMVAMLLPLMYEYSDGIRKRSELTKIIPFNFYGNIPGERMEELFKPWMRQYKAYNDHIVNKGKEYRANRKYNTEITLDIKEFFPSVSPDFIFKFVIDKLNFVYSSEEDRETLKRILEKLLVLNIKNTEFEEWSNSYYGREVPPVSGKYYTKGIPQGLPQAYFFGNLCMIEIREHIRRHDDFRNADASYYVDDSVIYIQREYGDVHFKEFLEEINKSVGNIGGNGNDDADSIFSRLSREQSHFCKSLNLKIKFHDFGKSEYCSIGDTEMSLNGLEHLARSTSMASKVFENLDETEDRFSREKLESITTLIDSEIKRVEELIKENKDAVGNRKQHMAARLKLLNRYKRFFLYRLKWLERRLIEEADEEEIKNFLSHIEFDALEKSIDDRSKLNYFREKWFESFDRDIFQSEGKLLLSSLQYENAESLKKDLIEFEFGLAGCSQSARKYLYFAKFFEDAILLRGMAGDSYKGLASNIRKFEPPRPSLSIIRQKEGFEVFVNEIIGYRKHINDYNNGNIEEEDEQYKKLSVFLPLYTHRVFINSDEFIRRIFNAYFSIQNEVIPSDARAFTKVSSRALMYAEFRILSRLRNKNFNVLDFVAALKNMDILDLDNRMQIDMGLLEVVGLFVKTVKNPDWIDNIIVTHRVVKGLWYNGSKFMNSYTLHNEEHAVTLIKWVVKLINAIDYLNIKADDYYILFLACYLHDISMVIHPELDKFYQTDIEAQTLISSFRDDWQKILDEKVSKGENQDSDRLKRIPSDLNFKKMGKRLIKMFDEIYGYFSNKIRREHASESARMIREWRDSVLRHLEPLVISEVARVSESHGYDSAEVYWRKSMAKDDEISEKYMMILIRLADLMDVANDRINYNLLRQNVKYMEATSRFHWISHLITDEIRLEPTYEVDEEMNPKGKIKPIEIRRITERLNFNLYLNVKFLVGIKRKCKVCRMEEIDSFNDIVKVSIEYATYEGLSLKMKTVNDEVGAPKDKCPILCRWCLAKHEWMVKELEELNVYLNATNDRWFNTEIRLNIIYKDSYPLDADLYHSAQDYVNGLTLKSFDK